MFCLKCGKEMPDGAAFCGNCGASMMAQPMQQNFQQWDSQEKKKSPVPIIVALVFLVVLAGGGLLLFKGGIGGLNSKSELAGKTAQDYEVTGEVEAKDFAWIFTDSLQDYTEINNFELLTGKWKAFIRPKHQETVTDEDLYMAEISGTKDAVRLKLQSKVDGTKTEASGTFDGVISLTGDWQFVSDIVMEMKGREYIYGTIILPSGEEAWLYLIRP